VRRQAHVWSASTLREVLAASTLCRLFGIHDGLSARLAQVAGVEGLWASGLGVSVAHAIPDASILTAADFLRAANSVVEATALPVVADCDPGFGDVNNVARMVRQFERAGVAAVCIGDELFRKRNSFMDSQVLADPYELAAKIAVAKQAQVSRSFMVLARIESLVAGTGMDDALARAALYETAGADALLIHSKSSQSDEVQEFLRLLRGGRSGIPVAIILTTYRQVDAASWKQADAVVYANQGLRATVSAVEQALAALARDGSTMNREGEIASVSRIFDLIDVVEHEDRELAAGRFAHELRTSLESDHQPV
jgi:phosphoenolpyruvate phosphomutase